MPLFFWSSAKKDLIRRVAKKYVFQKCWEFCLFPAALSRIFAERDLIRRAVAGPPRELIRQEPSLFDDFFAKPSLFGENRDYSATREIIWWLNNLLWLLFRRRWIISVAPAETEIIRPKQILFGGSRSYYRFQTELIRQKTELIRQ